jgi:site-specific DNA-methyltransferase (adenine-specific)
MKITDKIQITNEDNMLLMARYPDNYIDLTITSPPYNLGEKHHTGNKIFLAYDDFIDNMPENEYQENQINVLNEIFRITKKGGSLMYNHKNRIRDGKQISPYQWLLKTNWTIKQEIVWFNGSQNFDKCRFYPMTERIYWLSKGVDTQFENTINQHDLLKDTAEGTNKSHKRAFPLSLAERLIMCFPSSEIIFDPYTGSGTSAIATHNLNKYFIGCEISKKSYENAIKRIKNHTNQLKLF